MLCKYCGNEANANGNVGLSAGGTMTCQASPNKRHLAAASSQLFCAHCGKAVKPNGIAGLSSGSMTCPPSPTKRHELA